MVRKIKTADDFFGKASSADRIRVRGHFLLTIIVLFTDSRKKILNFVFLGTH